MALVGRERANAPYRASTEDTHVGDATLLGLPVELQKMILEHLSTNADKKNVCATSKKMQVLMTPLLYYLMELSSAQLNKRFSRTLESAGLSHVRILSIRSLSEAQTVILCRLIFALPKNALTRFDIPTCYLSLGVHCAFRLRQKKIANYQYGGLIGVDPSRGEMMWKALAPREDELAHVTALQILIIDLRDIKRMAWILAHIPALQHLDLEKSLSLLMDCDVDAENLMELVNSGNTTQHPARLKTLRIAFMCLTKLSVDVSTSSICLESLERLQLVECCEIGPLLEYLTQLRLNVSTLCIDRGRGGPRDGATISAFIASLAAPKRLSLLCHVDQPYDGQIDVDCLQKHAQSIEHLRLEDNNATWLTYGDSGQAEATQFCSFFESASNLKQLSLSGPDLEDESEVAKFLDIIKPLTPLSILKTQMFVVEKDGSEEHDTSLPTVTRLVEQTANKIFNTAFPQLAAVVMTVSGLPSKLFEDKTFAFLRSEQTGPGGGKVFVAVKIEPHMVKHHVACADILEEERYVYG